MDLVPLACEDGDLVALLLLFFECLVTVNVLWLILAVPSVGLQCVIVVFPDHTHFLFSVCAKKSCNKEKIRLSLHSTYTLYYRFYREMNFSYLMSTKV